MTVNAVSEASAVSDDITVRMIPYFLTVFSFLIIVRTANTIAINDKKNVTADIKYVTASLAADKAKNATRPLMPSSPESMLTQ